MSMHVKSTAICVVAPHFPLLRQWASGATSTDGFGPLVVLFTAKDRGVALSGVQPNRIGVPEAWQDFDSDTWLFCAVTLTSES